MKLRYIDGEWRVKERSPVDRYSLNVAAAVIGGAVLGVGGSAIAGHQAANATQHGTDASIAQNDRALQQQERLSQPYRELGEGAMPQLRNLLGITDPATGVAGDPTAALRSTPGYQFARNEGLQSTTNQATAMGLGLSGNTLEALDRYSTGLADQTYQSAVGNAQGVVGMGQAAAAGQASNIGMNAANNSSLIARQGENMAGINANTIAGITKSIGGAGNQYMTLQALGGFDKVA